MSSKRIQKERPNSRFDRPESRFQSKFFKNENLLFMKQSIFHSPKWGLLVALAACQLAVFSQNINPTQAANTGSNTEFIKHFQDGQPMTFSVSLAPGLMGGATALWEFCQSTALVSPCEPASFTAATNGVNNPLSSGINLVFRNNGFDLTAPAAAVQSELTLKVRLRNPGFAGRGRDYRFIIRDPFDLVFVLDRSGSMECPGVTGEAAWPACQAAAPAARWDKLKDAAQLLLDKLDANHLLAAVPGVTGDQMSVVYFSGSQMDGGLVNAVTKFRPVNIFTPALTGLRNDMTADPVQDNTPPSPNHRLAEDGTSFGLGLQHAFINRFGNGAMAIPTAGRRQVIVLFTDGEQNRDPLIESGQPGRVILGTGINMDNYPDLKVYAVSVSGPTAFHMLLRDEVASPAPPGEKHFFTTEDVNFASEIADNAFNEIFNTASPQQIRLDRRPVGPTQAAEAVFPVNKKVGRVLLEAIFEEPQANGFRYVVEKDGQEVTRFARLTTGDYYALLAFNFAEMDSVSCEGNWKLRVLPPPVDLFSTSGTGSVRPTNVQLIGTADDHDLDFITIDTPTEPRVGQKLNLSVRLAHQLIPIENAVVQVTISRPGEDLGELLARVEIPNLPPPNMESGSCAAQKLTWLKANKPAELAKLRSRQNEVIKLVHQGGGLYTGEYDGLDVSDIYKLDWSAKATHATLGVIERQKLQSIFVRFPDLEYADFPHPAVVNKKGSDGKKWVRTTLEFTPYFEHDGKKYRLGPGYEQAIGIRGGGLLLDKTTDHCDGSYTLEITGNATRPMTVFVGEEPIYWGSPSGFGGPWSRYRFGWSLHAGVANPIGELDSIYNRGGLVELDFSYRFGPRFSLEAVGGWYGFQKKGAMPGGSLFAKYHFHSSSDTEWVVGPGVGIFKPKNEAAASCWALRAGIWQRFSPRWRFGLEASYFDLPTPGYQFLTLAVGVKRLF